MRDPSDRRHERVLDGSLPSLPADRVGGLHENERQVAAKERAHEKVELRPVEVERRGAHAERAKTRGEVTDRKHADQAVEEPHHLPHPVALDDMHLPLGEAKQRVQLGMSGLDHLSSTSSPSSSRLLPDRRMKTSSRVAAVPSIE